jgi:hypothetical protein
MAVDTTSITNDSTLSAIVKALATASAGYDDPLTIADNHRQLA